MNGKILLATVEYLAKKPNPNEEDLRNEKRAWKQLVEIGIKEETEIPARLAEVEILSAEEVEQVESEKLEKERLEREAREEKEQLEREAAEQAEKDLLAKEETERRDKESKERNPDQGGEKGNGEAEQKQGDPNPETASQPKKTETKKAASPK